MNPDDPLDGLAADDTDPVKSLLRRHDRELAEIQSRLAGGGAGQASWCWDGLSPAELSYQAEDLLTWTQWLVGRYGLVELPQCWPRHPAMIEELIALRAARQGSYGPDAHSNAPLAWHEALELWRRRIREWDPYGCAGSRSHKALSQGTPDMPGPEAVEDLLDALALPPSPQKNG